MCRTEQGHARAGAAQASAIPVHGPASTSGTPKHCHHPFLAGFFETVCGLEKLLRRTALAGGSLRPPVLDAQRPMEAAVVCH